MKERESVVSRTGVPPLFTYFCVFSEEETSAKKSARRFADRKVRMYLYKMKKVDMHKYHVEMQKRKVP